MTNVGKVLGLFISKVDRTSKLERNSLTLDKKGIINDKYYDTNVQRSVLITSKKSYLLASSHEITMEHGALGENILIDYNPYHLNAGTQLQIGKVILEISQNCTICDHLAVIDKKLPTLLKNDRGIFAKVVKGGKINKEDVLAVL